MYTIAEAREQQWGPTLLPYTPMHGYQKVPLFYQPLFRQCKAFYRHFNVDAFFVWTGTAERLFVGTRNALSNHMIYILWMYIHKRIWINCIFPLLQPSPRSC
ncbi:hypothetical protein XENTR_v10022380 [Xenopus tropicalis]|nr:hypothetical protein XENTR_v10022380 [Xenopus tropicalis]